MRVSIQGAGLWTRGLTSYEALVHAVRQDTSELADATFESPRPASIPPRERRRAGLLINLAVEVAHQACEQANADKSTIASVFTSCMGDTAITDYMCRKLAGPGRLLSPAKFTNSVHNAASGYWSISTGNRAPSTFVGGFDASFGVALLEAASLATVSGEPVLLVAYDVANEPPMNDICDIRESVGVALVVGGGDTPSGSELGPKSAVLDLREAELRFVAVPVEAPMPLTEALSALGQANPMGAALALLERLAGVGAADMPLRLPAAAGGCIELRFLPSLG